MNNEDLPILNGYPLRLVVPGYYGTYWVKHLNEITVIDTVYDGFWMKTAYRIPNNYPDRMPSQHSNTAARPPCSRQFVLLLLYPIKGKPDRAPKLRLTALRGNENGSPK